MYTYSLILCFSVFLLIQQHEKQNKGLNYLLLVVEAVFLIFSKNNSDYSTYLMIYNGEMKLPFEIGIKTISDILHGIRLRSCTLFSDFSYGINCFCLLEMGKNNTIY